MESIVFGFFAATLLFYVLIELLANQRKASDLRFPSYHELPLVGHLQMLRLVFSRDPLNDYQKLIEKFPTFFKCWLFNLRFLCVHSPASIDAVLRSEACLNRPSFAQTVFAGFTSKNGDEWRTKRRFMNGYFHASDLKSFDADIRRMVDEFCDELERQPATGFDIAPLISRWTIRMNCLFLTGVGGAEKSVERVVEHLESLVRCRKNIANSLILSQLSSFLFLSKFSRVEVAKTKLIASIRDLLEKSPRPSRRVAKLSENYAKSLNADDFPDQVASLLDAGYETVAKALTYAVLFLSLRADLQARVRKSSDGDQPDLVEAIVLETLRLAPPLPFLPREATEAFEVEPGRVVASGTVVLVPNYGGHRLREVWGRDADRFNPERFFDARTKAAGFQFSRGKRMCIGSRYAMAVMRAFVAGVLRRFHFESDLSELTFTATGTLELRQGSVVRAFARTAEERS